MAAFGGAMVTVSEVRISPDLSFAKVFVSIFPSSKGDAAMETLQNSVKQIRGELGRLVAKQFRIVPEIAFYRDSTLDYVEHIQGCLRPPVCRIGERGQAGQRCTVCHYPQCGRGK